MNIINVGDRLQLNKDILDNFNKLNDTIVKVDSNEMFKRMRYNCFTSSSCNTKTF